MAPLRAGKRAAAFFKAFNSADEKSIKDYFESNLAAEALKTRSMEERMAMQRGLKSDLSTLGTVIQIGREPSSIDLLTAIDGVGFDEAWATKKDIQVDGMTIPVISRDEFLRNKRATGRHKDLADVERLESGNDANGGGN